MRLASETFNHTAQVSVASGQRASGQEGTFGHSPKTQGAPRDRALEPRTEWREAHTVRAGGGVNTALKAPFSGPLSYRTKTRRRNVSASQPLLQPRGARVRAGTPAALPGSMDQAARGGAAGRRPETRGAPAAWPRASPADGPKPDRPAAPRSRSQTCFALAKLRVWSFPGDP